MHPPVNDVLDVVVHALIVSSSVWLDVECNLGDDKAICMFIFIHYTTTLLIYVSFKVSIYRRPREVLTKSQPFPGGDSS